MPGVKANTQKKGGEKEAVGGGGAAGIKARLGGGNKVSCAICKVGKGARGAQRGESPCTQLSGVCLTHSLLLSFCRPR
jgi:hypothetical protein